MKKQRLGKSFVIFFLIIAGLTGCSSGASSETMMQTQPTESEGNDISTTVLTIDEALDSSLGKEFLSDVFAAKTDAFVSERAALVYLINFCGATESATLETGDEVDKVVSKYCDSDLYKKLK